MKVQEYRDLTAQMLRIADDWSACVDEGEREAWEVRARRAYDRFVVATCSRASDRDVAMHSLADERFVSLVTPKAALSVSPTTNTGAGRMSRAEKYNRSASRSVRLARAARSAMRRGYF